jgi:type I restriction enzyme S subunit
VKPGYKQTVVGVIPEDWGIVELDETARVVDSLHQTPSFAEDGYPMVRVTDIKPGNLTFIGTLMVNEAVFAEFTKNYKPKRGDIVLSRVGSYGVSSFVETDEPFCMGQNTVVLQPKLPPRFLYYVLNSRSIRRQIEDGSYGSGYKSLSLILLCHIRMQHNVLKYLS